MTPPLFEIRINEGRQLSPFAQVDLLVNSHTRRTRCRYVEFGTLTKFDIVSTLDQNGTCSGPSSYRGADRRTRSAARNCAYQRPECCTDTCTRYGLLRLI